MLITRQILNEAKEALNPAPDHECGIDCDPSMGGHMMYPVVEITWTRNGYGPSTMTRREWREYSGGIETRNVRIWNRDREERIKARNTVQMIRLDPDEAGALAVLLHTNPWDER